MYDITLTYNTACCLGGREQCVLALRSPLCSEKMCVPSRPVVKTKKYRPVPSKKKRYRPFPSWKNLYTLRSRREKIYAPTHPVEQKYIYTSKHTVPSRRDNFCLPSRPVVKQKGYCTVVPSRKFRHTVPSHPGNYNFHYFTVPPSIFFPSNMSKQYRTVPSRIFPAMKKP